MIAACGDIALCYETHGDTASGVPLLLVHGLGQQLTGWRPDLLKALVEKEFTVAVFDNRDVGLSTHLDGVKADLKAIGSGAAQPPYLVADLAADALAVMDAVGWDSAHVAGVSMGGMIAQQVAIDAPRRVRSLTSVMSTTGDRAVGRPQPGTLSLLVTAPPPDREGYIAHQLATWRTIGSPGYPTPEMELREAAEIAFDRAFDPRGTGRQFGAILASPDRTEGLRGLRVPALVVHGEDDPLVDISGGKATAAAIPGARGMYFPGMGHDLPRQLWPQFINALAEAAGMP